MTIILTIYISCSGILFETEATTLDDYNHDFPPFLRVIEGNYFELHKSTNDGDMYYIETKKKAIISTFCIKENCPSPTAVIEKKRGKEQEMYLVYNELHQA